MPRITFRPDNRTVDASPDDWMYDVCHDAKSSIPFSCKAGACGTCATEVLEGNASLGKPTQREIRTLAQEGLDANRYRLPCLCTVGEGDVTWGQSAKTASAATSMMTYDAEVESYRRLNLTVGEVRFFVPKADFEFRPGQYVIFQIPSADGPEIIRRSYSISTPPSDKRHFEICVRAVAGGHGSNWVHRLRPGQQVKVEGPVGDFVLRETDHDILMVATGTGISPIKSMLLHLLDERSTRRVRLLFGVRSVHDLFYTDLLRGLEAHYPQLSSEITLSSADAGQWAGARGRVTTLVEQRIKSEDAGRLDAYLCGSRGMIEDVSRILQAKGVTPERIHFENFY